MLNWIKNFFKKKPKKPCPECNDRGEVWHPVMQIGSMIEYEVVRCSRGCKKK